MAVLSFHALGCSSAPRLSEIAMQTLQLRKVHCGTQATCHPWYAFWEGALANYQAERSRNDESLKGCHSHGRTALAVCHPCGCIYGLDKRSGMDGRKEAKRKLKKKKQKKPADYVLAKLTATATARRAASPIQLSPPFLPSTCGSGPLFPRQCAHKLPTTERCNTSDESSIDQRPRRISI